MIILDTNVLSEPLRRAPDQAVLDWIRAQDDLGTTAITVGELLVGAGRLAHGHRRDELVRAIEDLLDTYRRSVLPYDQAAARSYASMQEGRRSAGRPLSVEDGMIAAICSTRSLTLATRNTKDFAGLGIAVVSPWDGRR